MIDAVLLFGLMNIILEMVLISMIPPRWRLRLLGNPNSRSLVHISFFLANLIVHWGTVIGTMSAVMAFIGSIISIQIAMRVYGYIRCGRYYHVGWIKYSIQELS